MKAGTKRMRVLRLHKRTIASSLSVVAVYINFVLLCDHIQLTPLPLPIYFTVYGTPPSDTDRHRVDNRNTHRCCLSHELSDF